MTKEDVVFIRDLLRDKANGNFIPVQLTVDNMMIYDESKDIIIWDDTKEIIYAIRTAPITSGGKNAYTIVCTEYDHIQYIGSSSDKNIFKNILTQIKDTGAINQARFDKIVEYMEKQLTIESEGLSQVDKSTAYTTKPLDEKDSK